MITRHFALRTDYNGTVRWSHFSELASDLIFKMECQLREFNYHNLFDRFREYYFIGMPGLPEGYEFNLERDQQEEFSAITYDQLINVLVINYAESIEGQSDDDIRAYWS